MAEENSTEKLLDRQLNVINYVLAGIGIMFFIAFAGIGYLQIKSASELEASSKEMKAEFEKNISQIKGELENKLPQYDQRINRLSDEINYKVDNKLNVMTKQFNEMIGKAPKPAHLLAFVNGQKVNNTQITVQVEEQNKNAFRIKLPQVIIKNDGGRITNQVMIYLYSSSGVSQSNDAYNPYPPGNWDGPYSSDEKGQGYYFILSFLNGNYLLNPNESWTLRLPVLYFSQLPEKTKLKLQFFFGSEEPLELNLIAKKSQ